MSQEHAGMASGRTAAPQVFAALWRRFAAFVIDTAILAVLGGITGWLMYEPMSALGTLGRGFGLCVALLYFGIMDSWFCDGRTLGKACLGIRVAGRDGLPLSMPRAFARTATWSIPWYLGDALAAMFPGMPFLVMQLTNVFTMVMIAMLYLFAFNRRTRQSLHDLVTGAFVLRAEVDTASWQPRPVWRWHAVLLGAAVLVPFASLTMLASTPTAADVQRMRTSMGTVVSMREVQALEWKIMTTWTAGKDTRTELIVTSRLHSDRHMDATFAGRVFGRIVGDLCPDAPYDHVRIVLVRGFDLGIVSWKKQQYFLYPVVAHARTGPHCEGDRGATVVHAESTLDTLPDLGSTPDRLQAP